MADLGATVVNLVRHGECAAQVDAAVTGLEAIGSRLTARGRGQAQAVAAALAGGDLEGVQPSGWSHGDADLAAAPAPGRWRRRPAAGGPAGDRVVVVTHGGFGSEVRNAALGTVDTSFQLDNASVSTLRLPLDPGGERPGWAMYPPVRCEVVAVEECSHMAAADRTAA